MSITIEHIAFDSTHAAELAAFWAGVFGVDVDAGGNEFFASVGKETGTLHPALIFLKVPEPRNGKNRLHVDLATTDHAAELDRIVGLGAKRAGDFDEYGAVWTTLEDPEGNLFDLGRVD